MSAKSPPDPSEALQAARLRAQQLAGAFEIVFGQPKKRTDSQKLVIEHLAMCAGDDANSYRFNEAKDGLALIAAGIHRDGARSMLRIIDRQLSTAITLKASKPKEAVSVKR